MLHSINLTILLCRQSWEDILVTFTEMTGPPDVRIGQGAKLGEMSHVD